MRRVVQLLCASSDDDDDDDGVGGGVEFICIEIKIIPNLAPS